MKRRVVNRERWAETHTPQRCIEETRKSRRFHQSGDAPPIPIPRCTREIPKNTNAVLRGGALVMVVQTEKNRARHDGPEGLRCVPPAHALAVSSETAAACWGFSNSCGITRTVGNSLADPLVWSHGVVVGDIPGQNLPELPLPDNDKPVQRLTPERTDETLDMGVHVRSMDRGTHAGDIVGVVGSETKDGIVVVDEMDGTRDGIA